MSALLSTLSVHAGLWAHCGTSETRVMRALLSTLSVHAGLWNTLEQRLETRPYFVVNRDGTAVPLVPVDAGLWACWDTHQKQKQGAPALAARPTAPNGPESSVQRSNLCQKYPDILEACCSEQSGHNAARIEELKTRLWTQPKSLDMAWLKQQAQLVMLPHWSHLNY